MGFINNTSYILNAVLTKKGREYLARPGSNFNITKFALSDDEIDYTLFDTAHPKGNDYYGAVLESTPMLEPCVDPEVVMKYKLFTMDVGTRALPYININPLALNGTNTSLTTIFDETNTAGQWSISTAVLDPSTEGSNNQFIEEDYSFLVLNKNVVDIGVGQGAALDFNSGATYGEESGRLSKKVVGQVATIKSGMAVATMPYERETSIVITGQMSGAVYVLPVKVEYRDNTPT
tara:strand:- start:1016 stop:1717 length:702 start_codon:yes stop_codon:yes gene_type:complete